MKTKHIIITATLVALLTAAGIWYTQEFRLYNIEGSDLFLYSWIDISGKLHETGGASLLIASFLTQFLAVPYLGVCIVTLLYLFAAWLIIRVLRKIVPDGAMSGFALLPVAFMFLCLENDYFRFYGHIALILSLLALLAFVSLPRDWRIRLAAGIIMTPVLYHLAGSASFVFAVSALVYELVGRGYRGLWSLAFPALVAAMAVMCVNVSLVADYKSALTPFMYYSYPSTYFFPLYAWACVPLLILAAWAVSKIGMKPSYSTAAVLTGIVFSFFIAGNFYSKVHSSGNYRFLQEQYWADNGQWDKIIETADRRQPTFLISYTNLALAQKGQLVERFRYFNPQTVESLMLPIPIVKNGLSLQANVYLAWGYLSYARQSAFDACQSTAGMVNPRMYKILIQSNLALGAYGVAEKYITILEKTLFYDDWASSMRRFLNNPEEISKDPVLGELVASLPLKDEYARYDGIDGDMRDILDANPDHRIMSQFYELFKILEGAK